MFPQSACTQRIDAKIAIIIKRARLGRADFSMVEVTKKKSAGPYLSSENAKKWPFIGTRESVA